MTKLELNIPKFDKTDYITGTEEQFQKELNKSAGNRFINEPGDYILAVDDIECSGVSKGDENWATFKFVLKTAEGATYNHFQLMPLKRVDNFKYGQKKTLFVYNNLRKFLQGFGIELDFETAMSTIAALLEDMSVFMGKKLKATIGYKGSYVSYLGTEGENKRYAIIYKGERLKDDEGEEVIFPDWKAAENYAAGISLKLQKFPEMLNIEKGNSITVAQAEQEEEYSDIPL